MGRGRLMEKYDHELKCWPYYFILVIQGRKPFEIRINDRNYKCGQRVLLREYYPELDDYSGNTFSFRISYVLKNHVGLKKGFCILGIGLDKRGANESNLTKNS